ncbi:hypothetical protein PLICRDRAFT_33066 [Plicaturopsis crispa FD-325 SS-3]|uniref:Uncharacterized protein n=1 Tax=Plicaturopsis crispa FD-325 SS-3 TaxID=944288 RepID=A0A0C9T1R5_PLICR|nr:hypothetical protein PLICRDRAFT_33066 [Plicaturopsis crispa FD-325 SS-3]
MSESFQNLQISNDYYSFSGVNAPINEGSITRLDLRQPASADQALPTVFRQFYDSPNNDGENNLARNVPGPSNLNPNEPQQLNLAASLEGGHNAVEELPYAGGQGSDDGAGPDERPEQGPLQRRRARVLFNATVNNETFQVSERITRKVRGENDHLNHFESTSPNSISQPPILPPDCGLEVGDLYVHRPISSKNKQAWMWMGENWKVIIPFTAIFRPNLPEEDEDKQRRYLVFTDVGNHPSWIRKSTWLSTYRTKVVRGFTFTRVSTCTHVRY